MQDLGDVTVYLGSDVTGNPQDAIVTVSFGPKNTVVAAYTADGNVYEYTGDLGDFYGVQNIRFVPVPELKKEIVIVREQVNQSLGSFEQSDILRGYVFDGKEYQDVLNTPQKIESSWNNLWNKGELQEPSLWRRVTEETESKYTFPDVIRTNDRATMMELIRQIHAFTICCGIMDDVYKKQGFIAVPIDTDETMKIGYVMLKNAKLSPVSEEYVRQLKVFGQNSNV